MARADAGIEGSDLQRTLVPLTVSSCTMLYSLTATIVNVTLPQLQGALSATPDQVAWVITLNLVATAVATPITGWIARFGQRQVMIWAVVGFTISSLLCATATSLAPLLIYRIGQGAFGAPMVPLAQAIVVATYPPERRAVAQGWFGVAVVLGPAIGPVLGGYLAEKLALGVSAARAAMRDRAADGPGVHQGPRSPGGSPARLDGIPGALSRRHLPAAGDGSGRAAGLLESSEIVLLTCAMAASFYVFLVHTLTHDKPFISPSLFLDRNFAVGLVFVFVYGMLNFTPITLLPPLLQSLKGYPDSLIGYVLGSRGVGMVLGFFLAGRMGRLDPRIGMLVGLGLVALSGVMLMNFSIDTSFGELAWMGFIQGLGTGQPWLRTTGRPEPQSL
jgi:DHA2 family multidrug resistance protein